MIATNLVVAEDQWMVIEAADDCAVDVSGDLLFTGTADDCDYFVQTYGLPNQLYLIVKFTQLKAVKR